MKNCNTNLNAITEKTLIVGIDVAKETHVARAFDYRGAELCDGIYFRNTREGFLSFTGCIESLKETYNKDSAIIGLEPTGIYGNVLIAYLKAEGYNVVYILGMQVKRAKEIEDNSPSKNDFKDAKVIAKLVKDGYYRKIRTFTDEITELKEATQLAHQITKKLVRSKCQIRDCMTEYFPEFTTVFLSVFKDTGSNKPYEASKTAFATLRLFPMPDQINAITAEQIVSAWRAAGVIKGIGIKKAQHLKRVAMDTVGLKASESVHIKIKMLMEEYDLLVSQEKEIWCRIKALIENNADYRALMQMPYMTTKQAAYLLAEVGDFRDFSHPQQLVRLAGLNLKECSSGKNRGTSEISKRGRPGLRKILYLTVLQQLRHAAPGWYQLHKRYTTRSKNPLKKMQSIIALCCKFLRVVWGMLNNGTVYDPGMLIGKSGLLLPNVA